MDDIRCPFQVFIADGGFDEELPRILSDPSSFPHVSYEYVRYQPDRCYADYYSKVENALSRIRTPFVAMTDNDDFFLSSSLERCVEFLRAHPDYATCGGQVAQFSAFADTDGEDALYGRDVRWQPDFIAQSPPAATARERMWNHVLRCVDPFYNVQRTAELRARFSIIRELNLADPDLTEFPTSCLASIAGETKQFDSLYLARQLNTPGSTFRINQAQCGDPFARMLRPSWSADFTNMVNALSTALADADGIPVDEARAWVLQAYRTFAAPWVLAALSNEVTIPYGVSVLGGGLVAKLPRRSALWRVTRALYHGVRRTRERAGLRRMLRDRRVAQEFEHISDFLGGGSRLP